MIQIGLNGGGRMRIADDGTVDVSEVTAAVLAFGLSNVTRFGGQAGHYSDAEHTVRMYDWAKADGQDKAVLRAILIHDAAECLGEGDVQRFVKRQYDCAGLKKFARDVTLALWGLHRPAGRETWSYAIDCESVVKDYDEHIGMLEARAFGFPHDPIPDWLDLRFAPTGKAHDLWTAKEGERQFLASWEDCS